MAVTFEMAIPKPRNYFYRRLNFEFRGQNWNVFWGKIHSFSQRESSVKDLGFGLLLGTMILEKKRLNYSIY